MFSCKCLNILIHAENNDIQKVEVDSLQLSDIEKTDAFFKKEIGHVTLRNIIKEQAGLVITRSVGPWIIHKCINCSLDTHGVHKDRGSRTVIISTDLLSGMPNILTLRNSENYSSVFRVLINSATDEQIEMSKFTVAQLPQDVQLAVTGLQQQLSEVLRREVNATEERIRRYTEMQYSALETFRERAHKEHHALMSLVLNSRMEETAKIEPVNSAAATSTQTETGIQPASPTKQSVTKPKNPIVSNLTKNKRPVMRQLSQPVQRLESFDAEGLFPLEGMDESPALIHSDVEESDTDDSASHDEGIHIPRQRAQSMNMAKSLPMNIPVFMSALAHETVDDKTDTKTKEDCVDIAASIKALAKSVHGDAVFGDLPRPRFSTQI